MRKFTYLSEEVKGNSLLDFSRGRGEHGIRDAGIG
jgi:hypothetical protein